MMPTSDGSGALSHACVGVLWSRLIELLFDFISHCNPSKLTDFHLTFFEKKKGQAIYIHIYK